MTSEAEQPVAESTSSPRMEQVSRRGSTRLGLFCLSVLCASCASDADPIPADIGWQDIPIDGATFEQESAIRDGIRTFKQDLRLPLPDVTVEVFQEAPADFPVNARGRYDRDTRAIELLFDEVAGSDHLAHVAYHELCHAIDHDWIGAWSREDFPDDPSFPSAHPTVTSRRSEGFALVCDQGPQAVSLLRQVLDGCDTLGLLSVVHVLASEVFKPVAPVDELEVAGFRLDLQLGDAGFRLTGDAGLDLHSRRLHLEAYETEPPDGQPAWRHFIDLDLDRGTLGEPYSIDLPVEVNLANQLEEPTEALTLNGRLLLGDPWNLGGGALLTPVGVSLPGTLRRMTTILAGPTPILPADVCVDMGLDRIVRDGEVVLMVSSRGQRVQVRDITAFVSAVYGETWRQSDP